MLLGGGLFYQQVNAVASVVSLDVNPSIELKVNRSEKVLVCTPLNEDAKAILADMGSGADLKGAKLDVAVNAIVGSLVRNGYLDSISSAIMISVEDKDTARAEKLQRELTSTVDGVLQTSESRASVLTQTLTQDAGREQQARENNISTGKAALVNHVLALNSALKFDALAKLSVEELKDLAEAGAPAMPIGKDKALSIAAAAFSRDIADEIRYSEVDAELDLDAISEKLKKEIAELAEKERDRDTEGQKRARALGLDDCTGSLELGTLQHYTLGTPALTLCAAWAYQQERIEEGKIRTASHQLELAEGELYEYVLVDEDMEAFIERTRR